MSVSKAVVTKPGAARNGDDAAGQLLGPVEIGHERAIAEGDVHDQAVETGRELLGEDRGGDQRDRFDGGCDVANGVQPAVGGSEIGCLTDDRAADLGDDLVEQVVVGPGLVAGDALELVERAARVTEAAAGDHRHVSTARRRPVGRASD